MDFSAAPKRPYPVPPGRELDPGNAAVHAGLADALAEAGLPMEAIPAYRRAAELDPGSAAVHAGLARALYTVGMTKDARQAHERAVDLGYGGAKWGRYDPYDWGV